MEPLDLETRDRIRSLVDAQIVEPPKVSARKPAQRRKVAYRRHRRRRGPRRNRRIPDHEQRVDVGPAGGDPARSGGSTTTVCLSTSPIRKGWSIRRACRRTVAEFASAIRLPEDGSFDGWMNHQIQFYRPNYAYETYRSSVAFDMVRVSQCQWVQRWLTATDASNDAEATQAIRILPGINRGCTQQALPLRAAMRPSSITCATVMSLRCSPTRTDVRSRDHGETPSLSRTPRRPVTSFRRSRRCVRGWMPAVIRRTSVGAMRTRRRI